MTSSIKKILLSVIFVSTFAFYVFIHNGGGSPDEGVIVPPKSLTDGGQPVILPTTENRNPVTKSPTPTPTMAMMPKMPMGMMGAYKNGEYVGAVADAYYGNVQVKAIIQSGKIADVQFLQYPNDRQNSIRINTEAMPYLTTEAIQAQSAQVEIISGATQTSRAFIESLQSALDQAAI